MVRKFPSRAKPQSERGRTPMDAALYHLSFRARTVREMERYLDDQQYGEYEVQQTVDRLQELGYLNDAAFAAEFVRTRLETKPVSRAKLQEQLLSYELPRDIVEQALLVIGDKEEEQNAICIARKYAAQMTQLDEQERARRLLQRMLGRGYSYDVCRAAINALTTIEE